MENDLKKYSKKKRLRQFRKKFDLSEKSPPKHNSNNSKSIKRKVNEKKQLIGIQQNKSKKVKIHNNDINIKKNKKKNG